MRTPSAVPPGAEGPGQAVAAARKARGFTQDELARRAAISLSLLRKVERGVRPLTPRCPRRAGLGAGRSADRG
jgi:DNA-binding transcriptional regulator YiaG